MDGRQKEEEGAHTHTHTHTHTVVTRFNVSWQTAGKQRQIIENSHSDQTNIEINRSHSRFILDQDESLKGHSHIQDVDEKR